MYNNTLWSKQWLVLFNPRKTESLLISRKQSTHIIHPTLYFDQIPVAEVNSHKHLGLIFNNSCHWGEHIVEKASAKLNVLRCLKFDLDRKNLTVYVFLIYPTYYGISPIIHDLAPFLLGY